MTDASAAVLLIRDEVAQVGVVLDPVLSGLVVQIDVSRLGGEGVRRVYAPPDVELPYTISDGKLRVVVPPLRVHTVLVIE